MLIAHWNSATGTHAIVEVGNSALARDNSFSRMQVEELYGFAWAGEERERERERAPLVCFKNVDWGYYEKSSQILVF